MDIAIPTEIGALQGSLEITQKGEAHYSIPLFVPPGVNGLTPSVSLQYRSNAHESEVGVGWTIGGLSSITLCPRNYSQRGPSPVDYTDADPMYCLDGIALVRISDQGVRDGAEYRTEYDSLVRVIARYAAATEVESVTGPSYFEVRTPDGRSSIYGGGDATGLYGRRISTKSDGDEWTGARRVWSVASIRDPQGNTVTFRYTDRADGFDAGHDATVPGHEDIPLYTAWATHPQISEIVYGGNDSIAGNRKVVFTRERLWDDATKAQAVSFGWSAGAPYFSDSQITNIAVYYEEQAIREYRLQYAYGTQTHLSKVYECALGKCKQPTSFTYKDDYIMLMPGDSTPSDALSGHSLAEIQSFLDADGDGHTDLLLNPNYDLSTLPNCHAPLIVAHASGDSANPSYTLTNLPFVGYNSCYPATAGALYYASQDNIYLAKNDPTNIEDPANAGYFQLSRDPNQGSGWRETGRVGERMPIIVDYNGDGHLVNASDTHLLDLDTNADGVPELVDSWAPPDSNEWPQISVDVHRTGKWVPLGIAFPKAPPSPAELDAFIRAHMQPKHVECNWEKLGWHDPSPHFENSWVEYSKLRPCWNNYKFNLSSWVSSMKVLDFNGDGLKDILTWNLHDGPTDLGPSLNIFVWYNTGRNQFVAQSPATGLADDERESLNEFLNAGVFKQGFAYDVDRDGAQEFVMIDPVSRRIWALAAGRWYQELRLSQIGASLPSWFKDTSRTLVWDADGNGIPDIVFGEGKKVAIAFQGLPEYGRLESVTDGLGRVERLDYFAGRGDGHYYVGMQPTLASKRAVALPPTVYRRTTTASNEGIRTENYEYHNGRVAYWGRGFLGFSEIDKIIKVQNAPGNGNETTVRTERLYYRPDTYAESVPDATAQYLFMYFEAGRPWKRETTLDAFSGLGKNSRLVTRNIVDTYNQKSVISDAGVPMWVPESSTTVVSETDGIGNNVVLTSSSTSYEYDQYGQVTFTSYAETGADGTLLEAREASIGYERDASALDRWQLDLVHSKTIELSNAAESTIHNETIEHNADGTVRLIARELGTAEAESQTSYSYNDRGNVTSVIESGGGVTRESDYFYDPAGDLVQYTLNPLLQSTSYAHYLGYGQLAGVQDANGLISSRRIDAFGREIQNVDQNGLTTEITYQSPGSEEDFLRSNGRDVAMAIKKAGLGQPTVYAYLDHFGRHIGTVADDDDAVRRRSQVFYDIRDRKTEASHMPFVRGGPPEARDHVSYDGLNRPMQVLLASDSGADHQAPYEIDYGHPSEVSGVPEDIRAIATEAVRTTYPNGSRTEKLLDCRGRVVAAIDRNGALTTYTYDPEGRLRFFTDEAHLTVENRYDVLGRRTFTSDPIRGNSSTTYTPLGDTAVSVTPTGTITQHFDALGRLTAELSPEGTSSWTYDSEPGSAGKPVEVVGPPTVAAPQGHRIHFTYGAKGEPAGSRGMLRTITSTIGGESFAIDYDYDSMGRVKTVYYPAVGNSRYSVTQAYSLGGRMHKITENVGGANRKLWEMTEIDALGRSFAERGLENLTTKYQYTDVEGRLKELAVSDSVEERLAIHYDYDIQGNVTSAKWREDGAYTDASRFYDYDAGDRLIGEAGSVVTNGSVARGASIEAVSYLSNGNIDSKLTVGKYTYETFGNPYAVSSVAQRSYSYDSIGRQISRPAPNGGQFDLTWTSFDTPSTVTNSNGKTIRYEYDGLKRRVFEESANKRTINVGDLYKRIDDLTAGTSQHCMMVRVGRRTVAEVTFTELPGGGVIGPDASALVADRLGSATLISKQNGDLEIRRYDAFGKPSAPVATKSGEGFAGYTQDDELDLAWMTNRLYDPSIARVLAPDPIISASQGQDGANRYAYVYNRPTGLIDPSGFEGEGTEGSESTPAPEETISVDAWVDGSSGGSVSNPPNDWFSQSASLDPYAYNGNMSDWTGFNGTMPVGAGDMPLADATVSSHGTGNIGWGVGDVINSDTWTARASESGQGTSSAERAVRDLRSLTAGDARHQAFSQQRQFYTSGTTGTVLLGAAVGVMVAGVALIPEVVAAEGTTALAESVQIGGEAWRVFQAGEPAIQNGCEAAAQAIQKAIGGEIRAIVSPAGPNAVLGGVRNAAGQFVNPAGSAGRGWFSHTFVVQGGRVYDALTGPGGMAAEAYKALWEYADVIAFGF